MREKSRKNQETITGTNPILRLDYPDPDVIRVEDTYYMISTTMHFMPGGVILKSYDLVNWEIETYVFDTLDDTLAQRLEGEQNIYGKGMWAASLRYHQGTFYVCFVCNDTQKTYLYWSSQIKGPWKKQNIEGFYHDPSLFFDDDGKVYIIYGNRTIYLTELREDLKGPKEGGLHRVIVEDEADTSLGYEGTHFYKIDGRYYVFFIHSLKERWFRTESCFWSDSLEGEFIGKDVLVDDMGYRGSGVAQGGIVDTPNGDWYAVLFQDRGGVGRIPCVIPIRWEEKIPVFGEDGKAPLMIQIKSNRGDYEYEPLVTSDDFCYKPNEVTKKQLKKQWQWNHNPHHELWSVTEREGALRLYSGKVSKTLTQSYNTLTQRTLDGTCACSVTVDGSGMKNGDTAGIVALLGAYGAVGLTKEQDQFYLVMFAKEPGKISDEQKLNEKIFEKIPVDDARVSIKCVVDYQNERDEAEFFYQKNGNWIQIGRNHKLVFQLDHFTGCRFGLYYWSREQIGGWTDFCNFIYEK